MATGSGRTLSRRRLGQELAPRSRARRRPSAVWRVAPGRAQPVPTCSARSSHRRRERRPPADRRGDARGRIGSAAVAHVGGTCDVAGHAIGVRPRRSDGSGRRRRAARTVGGAAHDLDVGLRRRHRPRAPRPRTASTSNCCDLGQVGRVATIGGDAVDHRPHRVDPGERPRCVPDRARPPGRPGARRPGAAAGRAGEPMRHRRPTAPRRARPPRPRGSRRAVAGSAARREPRGESPAASATRVSPLIGAVRCRGASGLRHAVAGSRARPLRAPCRALSGAGCRGRRAPPESPRSPPGAPRRTAASRFRARSTEAAVRCLASAICASSRTRSATDGS